MRHVALVAALGLTAAGMAAQAIQFYADAGWITALDRPLWDTSWLLSDSSVPGRALHALLGYTDRPTGAQISVYLCVSAIMIALARLARSPTPQPNDLGGARG